VSGKAPLPGLRVHIEEVFFHCGRALLRARLWDLSAQIDRTDCPTYGQALANQIEVVDAEEIDAAEQEINRDRLY
jgi:hypothetical protein